MVLREKLYTVEEFREIARLPENEDKRLELEDGVIVEMPGSRPVNSFVAIRIAHFLMIHATKYDLGMVGGADASFKLKAGTSRQPDVSFVPKSQLPSIPNELDFAPALAVEVVSPREDVFKKVNEYLEAGTAIVWAVYCDEKRGYVFTQDESGVLRTEIKGIDDVLSGGDVLPDFELPVKDIFPSNMGADEG